jgi:hypothetical protein
MAGPVRCTRQALIDAPVGVVWELVGNPERHPEWWPGVVDVECDNAVQGCVYRQIQKPPVGKPEEHEIALDALDDLQRIHIRCVGTGMYNRFDLTPAADGTFVEAEFGIDPDRQSEKFSMPMRVITPVLGRTIMQRWVDTSLEGLQRAASEELAAED